jgi:hypothetical protein
MAHTWHHDRKRHLIHGRLWPFVYSGAGPTRWRRTMMEKPARRKAHVLERNCVRGDMEHPWPHPRKPTIYYF